MHALCKGNIAFFEVALAKIAKMPPAEVHNTLFGLDNEDVLDLYTKAELPDGAFEAVFIILSYAVQDTASGKFSRTNFASRTSERIISAGQDSSVPMMQNMLAMISSKSSLFDE